jgi:hypothetical protein
MMRYALWVGAVLVVLGLLVQRGWGNKPDERERISISAEEYHYRQAATVPYSAFLRRE